jgi:ABC-type transport system involved in multi-copper enzyme maturation permease subunit
MSVSTPAAPMTMDVSGTAPIPFTRLVQVELRKMFDTRAGRWLVISIAALTALVLVIQLIVAVGQDVELSFRDFMAGANTPIGILLPVLGIMAVTSEWSQRTAMVTFTLEPLRGRLIAAKLTATGLLAVAAIVIGVVLAVCTNLLYGVLSDFDMVWGVGAVDFLNFFLLHLFGMASGFAFGALFLNTPAAIVVYFVYSFVLPGLFELGSYLMDWFADLRPWIDASYAQTPLFEGDVSGKEWAYIATTTLIWLVLPLVVGVWRIFRAEVK